MGTTPDEIVEEAHQAHDAWTADLAQLAAVGAARSRAIEDLALASTEIGTLTARIRELEDAGPAPAFPTHPGVVVAGDQIGPVMPGTNRAAALARIISSGSTDGLPIRPTQRFASITYKPWIPGTSIDLTPAFPADPRFGQELVALKDDAVACKVQALLAVLGPPLESAQRVDNVVRILDAYAPVRSFAKDAPEQRRLVGAGWALTNICQAMSLTGLVDHPAKAFVERVAFGADEAGKRFAWWTTGANWLASFADGRLAAACITGREDHLDDARRWLEWSIARSIYHPGWDGMTVVSFPTEWQTIQHWNGAVTASFRTTGPAGLTAEERRDINHDLMGLGAFAHAAMTLRHQGLEIPAHVLDRLEVAYERKASMWLDHVNGTKPYPYPIGSSAGTVPYGWLEGRTLLEGRSTPKLLELCRRPEIAGTGVGNNALVAASLTDG